MRRSTGEEFERLLAGEAAESVFAPPPEEDDALEAAPESAEEARAWPPTAAISHPRSPLATSAAGGAGDMRHQGANVHELARIEMLAGLPGESLARLAEQMERQVLAPGEQSDVDDEIVAILSGLAHATDTGGARDTAEPGSVLDEDAGEAVRADAADDCPLLSLALRRARRFADRPVVGARRANPRRTRVTGA